MNGKGDLALSSAVAVAVAFIGDLGAGFWTLVGLGLLEVVVAFLADWSEPRDPERRREQAVRVGATWLMVPFAKLLQPFTPAGVDLQSVVIVPLVMAEALLVLREMRRAGVPLPEALSNLLGGPAQPPRRPGER